MRTDPNPAEERLTGRKSLQLSFAVVGVVLVVAFAGELAIMWLLPELLPGAGETARSLADAALLAVLLAATILPLLLHLRARNLRRLRRALRVQYTLDQHAIVSITDTAGRITFANDRFCEISGYTREELLGQNHRILKSGLHPPELYADMWRTIAGGNVWHGDVCNRTKAGGLYWVHATITPFLDARGKPEEYVAIRTEITAQKDLERESRRQEARLRTILDNLGEGVYTLDAQGRLAYLNAEAERLIGWRLDELVGRKLHDIIHHHRPDGNALPAAECPIHLAMREQRVFRSSEEVFFHKDGSAFPVKVTGAPLSLDGERQGSVAVFSDMREQELLNRRLLEARDAAEDAARLKADFLSTMSHEIRTPLNGVIGMTDLLLDTPLDGEQTEFARTIKTSADALMAIINDILDFSKIEAGRLVLEQTSFSLRQIVESSLDVLAARAQEKELLLAALVAPGLPDHVVGDPTRVRQILLNFLSNAIKFTERGEVVASARLDDAPDAGPGRIMVRLAVRDSGIGLSEAAQAGLFQPFSQADSSTTRKYGGTGLGLSISKRLAEAMDGRIGVDSVAGAGATFWIAIPLELAEEKRSAAPPEAALAGRRVLVAGAGAGGIWRNCCEAWDMQCEDLPGLAELRRRLAQADATALAPDLLLLAQPLPDANLAEAVAELQALVRYPIVCCLARTDRELRAALLAQRAGVMQQPLKQTALSAALLAALGAAPARPGRRASDLGAEATVARQAPLRHSLLLAEDNPVNQRVAAHLLGKLGYAVDVVDNGALAVAAVAAGRYALVLMDCQMPEMDGYAATAAIRKAEAGRSHLPIVAMTANALQGDRERCIAAGMDDYIAKPIDVEHLSTLLAHWLPGESPVPTRAAVAPADPAIYGAGSDGGPPAIDLRRLNELLDGDPALIGEMLAVFGEALPPLRARLQAEVAAGGANLKRITHEVRGAAANVGADRLAQLAAELEALAPGGDRDRIERLAARIDAEFERIAGFLSRHAG